MTEEHPEDGTPTFDQDALQIALNEVDEEANCHNAEYAAGMRHAHLIFEQSLYVEEP
jgi:hypothetical protein